MLRAHTTAKNFTGHIDNDKCNTLNLEAKGIANVHADSVSGLKAVGLYHDIDSKDHKQEFSTPFEPLPPVEPVTYMTLEMNEVFIAPDIEKLMQTYDILHGILTGQTNDDVKLSLENVLPTDIPQ